jgi:hypothetical protein
MEHPRKNNMKLAQKKRAGGRPKFDRESAKKARAEAIQRLRDLAEKYKQMSPAEQMALERLADNLESYTQRNKILIALQAWERGFCPSAVGPASMWRESGRLIKKGEHALRILAPVTTKGAEPKPEDGILVLYGHEFGGERGKCEEPIFFKAVPVFDISQTIEAEKAPLGISDGTADVIDEEDSRTQNRANHARKVN